MSARCIFFICCSLGDGLVIYLWCTCGLWWTCGFIWMDLSTYYYICDIYCDGRDMCGWMCGWMRYICDEWDIYVMDEIYDCMNLFVMMECKKIVVFGHFAECCTRQRTPLSSAMTMALGKYFFLKKIQTLPSAGHRALGKEFFFKKKSNFAECRPEDTRQRIFFKKKFKLCRAPARGHSVKNF